AQADGAGGPSDRVEIPVNRADKPGVAPGEGRDRDRRAGLGMDLLRRDAGRQRAVRDPEQQVLGLLQVFGPAAPLQVPIRQPEGADHPGVAGQPGGRRWLPCKSSSGTLGAPPAAARRVGAPSPFYYEPNSSSSGRRERPRSSINLWEEP